MGEKGKKIISKRLDKTCFSDIICALEKGFKGVLDRIVLILTKVRVNKQVIDYFYKPRGS